jgi:hypothetical protein
MTDALRKAAQAVLDRWDSPKWEWISHGPTADLMTALRTALAAAQPPAAMPVPEPMTRFCPGCGGVGYVERVAWSGARSYWVAALDAAAQPVPATGAQPQK